jgi:hypothetical protein
MTRRWVFGTAAFCLVACAVPALADDFLLSRGHRTPQRDIYDTPRAFPHQRDRGSVYVPPPTVEVTRGRKGWEKDVIVQPEFYGPGDGPDDLSPADQVMAELADCIAGGTTLLVPCLRQNHRSVSIRRLEACLRSDSIPSDGNRVRDCLADGAW